MIVVTGATGNVGRPLLTALVAGGEQVTAVGRRLPDADAVDGVRYRPADLSDPDSLRPVLDGAGALFLIVAGDDPQGLVGAAKAAGVGRVVLLSTQGVATRPGAYRHAEAFEAAVRQAGPQWTVLRPGGFHSNALAWAGGVRARRTVAAPFADVGLPTVDPADIAAVAAVLLRGAGHPGRSYELTGPALTTPRQRTEAIGAALGEPVRFVEHSRGDARAEMLQFMPEPVVDATLAILGTPTAAEQRISPAVEQLLGRAPRPFADWAQRTAVAFR